MRFDIEIACLIDTSAAEKFEKTFNSFCVIERRPRSDYIHLRTKKSETKGKLVSQALQEFLADFINAKDVLRPFETKVRIGIFYNVEEHAFLNVDLQQAALSLLGQLNCSLEISAYPCSDGQQTSAPVKEAN